MAAAASLAVAIPLAGPSPWLLAPAALWGASVWTRGIRRILLHLAAPLTLAAAVPIQAPMGAKLVLGLAVVTLALVPLVRGLGPAGPSPRAGVILSGSLLLPVVFFLTPPGSVIASSDLATGALILAIGAGLGVTTALVRPRTG